MEYGYEKCPLDDGKSCFDYDRLGSIACGICGANKELAKEGQENFWNGIQRDNEESKKRYSKNK